MRRSHAAYRTDSSGAGGGGSCARFPASERRFGGVLIGQLAISASEERVAGGEFMVSRFVVFGGGQMVTGGALVMLGRFAVKIRCLCCHGRPLFQHPVALGKRWWNISGGWDALGPGKSP